VRRDRTKDTGSDDPLKRSQKRPTREDKGESNSRSWGDSSDKNKSSDSDHEKLDRGNEEQPKDENDVGSDEEGLDLNSPYDETPDTPLPDVDEDPFPWPGVAPGEKEEEPQAQPVESKLRAPKMPESSGDVPSAAVAAVEAGTRLSSRMPDEGGGEAPPADFGEGRRPDAPDPMSWIGEGEAALDRAGAALEETIQESEAAMSRLRSTSG
jgi:hypothetical protein